MVDFKQFDRELEDLRNDVAIAHGTMRKVVSRYVAMMTALDYAFALFYDDMPTKEQAAMKAAFDKLAETVETFTDKEPAIEVAFDKLADTPEKEPFSNVQTIKR